MLRVDLLSHKMQCSIHLRSLHAIHCILYQVFPGGKAAGAWRWPPPIQRRSKRNHRSVDCIWNVMAHAQKPDFVFRRNGPVHLNRRGGGGSVQSTTGSWGVRISGSNAGYTMFRGSVKGTGYPTPFASFPFTYPPVRHRVPSHFNLTLPLLPL